VNAYALACRGEEGRYNKIVLNPLLLIQIAGTDYQITDDLHALRLAVHPEPVYQPYSGPRIVLGLTPRFSSTVPESDVLSGHEDSEEEDEAGHRSPTF
jgi:hypothetical protein